MQTFADLIDRLILTSGRNAKLALMENFFRTQTDPSRGWVLASLTGELEFKSVKPAQIRTLITEKVDAELFRLSYDFVGDLAETTSLMWPERHGANTTPDLPEIVETLQSPSKADGIRHVERWMDGLDPTGRWALLKFVMGGLRIGVSARLAKQALANYGSVDVKEIEEIWHGLEPPYLSLFQWLDGKGDKPTPDIKAPFRPVMLAHPLISKQERNDLFNHDLPEISADTFAAEWKWDGIRVQASSEGETKRLYTRTGDDISHTFPDVIADMNFVGILDGELVVRSEDGGVASFNDLQLRLNRKTVSKKMLAEKPAFVRTYDILQAGDEDLRHETFRVRRTRLEAFVDSLSSKRFDLSNLVEVSSAEQLNTLRNAPPHPEIEGLMLKRWDSIYEAGRPKGPWYKWKRDPYLVDAIIMYAQRGHGRRSGYFSDFTFGVWKEVDGELTLTPVGKAYFGFTDDELKELDKYVRQNTIERFGPVHSVTANQDKGLVVEVAFEGLQRSTRHKSGLAMRFPRFNRIRWDKPPSEADNLEMLEKLIT